MKTKFYTLIFLGLFSLTSGTISAQTTDGDGNILISTPQELNGIRNNLSASYKLTTDIDLNGLPFSPIGVDADGQKFTGKLLGNGKKIKNAHVSSTGSQIAFFASTDGATISDVDFVNLSMTGNGDVASVVGIALSTTIKRVVLTNPEITGSDRVGGFIGQSHGHGTGCLIENSYIVDGKITTNSKLAGGFIGYGRNITIRNSYITGEIVAPTVSSANTSAGVVGEVAQTPIALDGVALLVNSITGGLANHFVARGSGWTLKPNTFAADDIVLSEYADASTIGEGRAPGNALKSRSDLKLQSTYETMGWDFVDTWVMSAETGYPVLKLFTNQNTSGVNSSLSGAKSNLVVTRVDNGFSFKVDASSEISIYNLKGEIIKSFKTNNEESCVLPKGVFLVKAVSANGTELSKIVNY